MFSSIYFLTIQLFSLWALAYYGLHRIICSLLFLLQPDKLLSCYNLINIFFFFLPAICTIPLCAFKEIYLPLPRSFLLCSTVSIHSAPLIELIEIPSRENCFAGPSLFLQGLRFYYYYLASLKVNSQKLVHAISKFSQIITTFTV